MRSTQAFLPSAALKIEMALNRHAFSADEQAAVYRAISERRDMRHFSGGCVPEDQLQRLLTAAHHAPSVGLMQPWRFIRVQSSQRRRELHDLVEHERILTAKALGRREDEFMKLKVQGILQAAEVLVVALPPGREQHIFGRRTLPEMDLASTACAIQNLWLAARAEGLGMGWVSMYCPHKLMQLFALPVGSHPMAILCLGPVDTFYDKPMLETEKWARPATLASMLFVDAWGQTAIRLDEPADLSISATSSIE
jgi:5,6-dimethylbenzimidazole synthase